jgi:outer membrane protein OmpA-like peptidoglycan-associated protein
MTSPISPPGRRARRRILLGGGVALSLVAAAGAIEGIPRAERDLERRVDRRLAARGFPGVHSSFSGQDGTLHCDEPIADADGARNAAENVWGVRVAKLADSCVADGGVGTDGAASATTTTAADTTAAADVTDATDADSTVVPSTDAAASAAPTTGAPTTTAPTTTAPTTTAPTTTAATTTTTPVVAAEVTVTLDGGRLALAGTVGDEASRAQLVEAAGSVVDPDDVDDSLTVDDGVTVDLDEIDALGTIVAVLPDNLVSGTATLADGALAVDGVYLDAAARAAVDAAAAAAGATTDLSPRAEATASDAAALADELNAFVTANPILFAPRSATLTPEAGAVVDQVAAIANRLSGVYISVIGHTDTDGDTARNLALSEQRAAAVRDALLDRGVTAPLSSSGRGEAEPVLVGGVEDKAASRRVVFDVTTSA